jgi:hypothetical protein
MEAVRTSETSVNFNVTTWHYIPEDSKLRKRPCLIHTLSRNSAWRKYEHTDTNRKSTPVEFPHLFLLRSFTVISQVKYAQQCFLFKLHETCHMWTILIYFNCTLLRISSLTRDIILKVSVEDLKVCNAVFSDFLSKLLGTWDFFLLRERNFFCFQKFSNFSYQMAYPLRFSPSFLSS